MKSNKEFTDSIYMKYEAYQKAEKQREAARKRTIRYVSVLAACLVLAIGFYSADRLGYISTGIFGDDTIVDPGDDQGETIDNNDTPQGNYTPDIGEPIDDNDTPQTSPEETDSTEEGSDVPLGGIAAILAALGAGIFGFSKKRRNK